jgi:hypothetical protein
MVHGVQQMIGESYVQLRGNYRIKDQAPIFGGLLFVLKKVVAFIIKLYIIDTHKQQRVAAMLTIITDVKDLIPGKWYAIACKTDNCPVPETAPYDWGGAPIHRYEGDGEWTNEYDEAVYEVWDTDLQMYAGINSADAYMPQS